MMVPFNLVVICDFKIKCCNIDYVKTVDMSNCYDYDIAIDANNNITSTPIDRNEWLQICP